MEALRGLQRAQAMPPPPEVGQAFVEDTLRAAQMLMESVIGELEAGGRASGDAAALRRVLAAGAEAVRHLDEALADDIAGAPADDDRLGGLLERLLIACEDATASGEAGPALSAVRAEAYAHLREVAARGWSLWDMLSFRERMARLRSEGR